MKTFNDILGQSAAIDGIRRAYVADRLPHGLIFAGPAGVGKATTGAALGKVFLCQNAKGDVACGRCESCRVFDGGNHPDYHVITKELIRYHDKTGKSKGIDLSIHVLRPELIEPANRKAMLGQGKVFVVEQAELMNAQAQNAMLKTLEEPLVRTLIFLLADQVGSLLPTIRSRCQTFRFAPLESKLVLKELEQRGIDPATAADAARYAEGSLGIALRWIDDGIIAPARELSHQLDELMAGRPPDNLPHWLKGAAEAYAQKQLERDELASKDQANREGLNLYLRLAAAHFRRALAASPDPEALEKACAAIDAIVRAESYLDANVNVPIVLQQLSLTLSRTLVAPMR
jgi:DNA polymerase III delta' subunit